MSEPNEIIHQSLRLKIMAGLAASAEPVEFARLKTLVQATDGNLGAHLSTLEKAGYLVLEKDYVGKKPRTRAAITPQGRQAFGEHVAFLRKMIEAAGEA